MKKFFAPFILWIASAIPPPRFSAITFWKSPGKYIYYCLSDTHIPDEKTFRRVFPEAIRISQTEFDLIIHFRPDKEVVEVADDFIIDENKEA